MENERMKYVLVSQEENFPEAFSKLLRASYSVWDSVIMFTEYFGNVDEFEPRYHKALEDVFTEEFVTSALAVNVISDRKTGNSVGWGGCGITVSAYGVDYDTGGGLNFGWEVQPEWDGNDFRRDNLTVYCHARVGGTLEKSLKDQGFTQDE